MSVKLPDGALVLVVSDNPADVFLVEDAAREDARHIELEVASTGEEALARLASGASSRPPDLVLLDLHLPGVDGFEVLEQVWASDQTYDVPLIVLTSSRNPEHRQRARKLGAHDYLEKPFDTDEFIRMVRTVWDRLLDAE